MRLSILILLGAVVVGTTGCRRDGCTDPKALNYDEKAKKDNGNCIYIPVPDAYSFKNVDYSGQTERLNMMDEMVAYMKTANTSGVSISGTKLKEMYENSGNHFSFTSSKQLKDKTFSLDQALFMALMDSLEMASLSTSPGSDGVAGVVTSNDGSKKYLFDANGKEFGEIIQKGLMGAVFYYQVTGNYLTADKIGNDVDNTTVTEGKGTPMQHHWDEAFGYFGVPVDFPENKDGIRYYGKYSNARDPLLGTNETLMNAFIKGRASILFEDYEARDEQVTIIKETWEKVIAATAISYLNKAKADLADDAIRNHTLSEAVGFINALKYNPTRKITESQISTILGFIGNNFYNVTTQGLDNARNELSTIYGLDSYKNTL